jgi:hypothetical protein
MKLVQPLCHNYGVRWAQGAELNGLLYLAWRFAPWACAVVHSLEEGSGCCCEKKSSWMPNGQTVLSRTLQEKRIP